MPAGRLEGRRFGSLTVIRKAGLSADQHVLYECRCECGATVIRSSHNVQRRRISDRRPCHKGTFNGNAQEG